MTTINLHDGEAVAIRLRELHRAIAAAKRNGAECLTDRQRRYYLDAIRYMTREYERLEQAAKEYADY